MIQTYFGNGKGKTTAAVGLAVRCSGCGKKVLFVQFLKNNDSAEFKVLETIPGIDIVFSAERYELYDNLDKSRTPLLCDAYRTLLLDTVQAAAPSYEIIILDEILDAVEFGYISEDMLLQFLNAWKDRLEIILTGHKLPKKIADVSDYVSEVKEIKHPYQKGVLPREGMEY